MKILMVVESEFPPDDRVEKEALSLINDGHQVAIACYTFKKPVSAQNYRGIIIFRKYIPRLIYKSSVGALRFPVYFRYWSRYLKQVIKENSFDTLHIHDLPLAKTGFRMSHQFRIKLVIDLHENYPASLRTTTHTQKKLLGRILHSDRQWRRYEKKYVQKTDLLITVVEEMKQRIVKLGADAGKIVVLENTPLLNEYDPPENKPSPDFITLFYAGGINIYRGLQIVIDGMAFLIPGIPNLRLWIIGKGSYEQDLRRQIQKKGLNEHVTFFGWKPLKEISALLAQSDIALIPHLKSEQTDCSSPNKIYQYALANKPIVCSNCNSLERLINEWNNGIVYIHDSPDDFSKKVGDLIKSDKFRQMGLNGKMHIVNKYNWNNSVRSLLTAYKNLQMNI